MRKQFTGRTMATIMIAGFGIVIAVNLVMARYATSSFSGVVVENSYVASQKFNGWLDEADRQAALGWSAAPERVGDRLAIDTVAIPFGANVSAKIRRPLGEADTRVLTFGAPSEGRYLSQQALPPGRWIVRTHVTSGPDSWSGEDQIP